MLVPFLPLTEGDRNSLNLYLGFFPTEVVTIFSSSRFFWLVILFFFEVLRVFLPSGVLSRKSLHLMLSQNSIFWSFLLFRKFDINWQHLASFVGRLCYDYLLPALYMFEIFTVYSNIWLSYSIWFQFCVAITTFFCNLFFCCFMIMMVHFLVRVVFKPVCLCARNAWRTRCCKRLTMARYFFLG